MAEPKFEYEYALSNPIYWIGKPIGWYDIKNNTMKFIEDEKVIQQFNNSNDKTLVIEMHTYSECHVGKNDKISVGEYITLEDE